MEHRQFMPFINLGATLAMNQTQQTNTVYCVSLVHHEQGHHQVKNNAMPHVCVCVCVSTRSPRDVDEERRTKEKYG